MRLVGQPSSTPKPPFGSGFYQPVVEVRRLVVVDRSVLRALAPPGLTVLVIASGAVATSVASGPAAAVVMGSLLAGSLGLVAALALLPRRGARRRSRGHDLAAEWARVEPGWSARLRDDG